MKKTGTLKDKMSNREKERNFIDFIFSFDEQTFSLFIYFRNRTRARKIQQLAIQLLPQNRLNKLCYREFADYQKNISDYKHNNTAIPVFLYISVSFGPKQ